MSDLYKPLSPAFRRDINDSISTQLRELHACGDSGPARAQMVALGALRAIITALPDGYPVPGKKEDEE